MHRFLIYSLGTCIGCFGFFFAQGAWAQDGGEETIEDETSDSEEDDTDKWVVGINAIEEYRMRYSTAPIVEDPNLDPSPAEVDHDVRLLLSGSIQDPKDVFFADMTLGLWWDLNGAPVPYAGSAQASQYDEAALSEGSPSIWLDVYSLYGEFHTPSVLALARLGRQQAEHGRPATFDGATLRMRVVKHYLEVFAFGGRTVHFFNTDDDGYFEDFLVSGGLVIRPARILRFELDYRYLREDTLERNLVDDRPPVKNNSYGLQGWLHAADWFYLKGHVRGIDDRISRVGGATMMVWDKINLGLDFHGDLQLVALDEVNERDDPFFSVLGQSRPNFRAHADLWKGFETGAGTYTAHAGWDARLLALNEPTMFNRDYGKIYFWLQATDIGVEGPFAGAMLSYHYSHQTAAYGDDSILSVGGSLGWDRRPVKFEAGTYFSKFKYNYYQSVEERENVRTYFGEFGVRPFDWLKVKARYEFERFDRDIHQVTISLSQNY